MEVYTGINRSGRKVLRQGCTLYAGTHCHDGRPITESARYQEAIRRGIPIIHETVDLPVPKSNASLWVDTYKPRQLTDVIGHTDSISQLKAWLTAWPTKGRGVLISGPPGIGKSSVAHLLAQSAGYAVAEYNASDTRSISMLKGLFGLGMKRLRKELVVMDEIDGFTTHDRGGVGELAELITKSNVPIICIANQLPPKMAPLQKACLVIKFSRPVKSTIATALLGICKKENVTMSKAELELLCEQNGNDVRMMLNHLQFNSGDTNASPHPSTGASQKDSTLRLDLFSATQKLMSNKRCSISEADDFVYVDYGMVPLMVQEAYLAASKTLDEAVAASEQVSFGDLMSTQQWSTQDWSLLPHVVHSAVATSRKVTGPCPFQIFPKLLGKNATRGKHQRGMEVVGRIRGRSASSMRLDETESLCTILMRPLASLTGDKADAPAIASLIERMDAIRISRDHLFDLSETVCGTIEIPTRVKSMLTRAYNKGHTAVKSVEEEDSDLEV